MADPNFYREYDCNISCPKCRCQTARVGKLIAQDVSSDTISVADSITFTDCNVVMYTGKFALANTFTFTSTQLPALGKSNANGELTLYLSNDIYANVSMAAFVRAKSTNVQALIYQRVGNFVSVNMTYTNNTIVVTCSPAATCNWLYRGI